MRKTVLFLVFLFFYFIVKAQENYPDFPRDQLSYLGGNKAFFKDFHKILIEKQLKPCDNKTEHPFISFLIRSSDSVEVLDLEKSDFEENKCTFELTKEVVKYMTKWIPAKIDGKETPAVKRFFISPSDLFEDYKDGYIDAGNANFDQEIFRKEVGNNVDLSSIKFKGTLTVYTKFRINTKRKIDNINIEKSSGSQDFDEMFTKAIEIAGTKIHLESGTFLGQPVNLYFKMTFSASSN